MAFVNHITTGTANRLSATSYNSIADKVNSISTAAKKDVILDRNITTINVYNAGTSKIHQYEAAVIISWSSYIDGCSECKYSIDGFVPVKAFDGTSRRWVVSLQDIEPGECGSCIYSGVFELKGISTSSLIKSTYLFPTIYHQPYAPYGYITSKTKSCAKIISTYEYARARFYDSAIVSLSDENDYNGRYKIVVGNKNIGAEQTLPGRYEWTYDHVIDYSTEGVWYSTGSHRDIIPIADCDGNEISSASQGDEDDSSSSQSNESSGENNTNDTNADFYVSVIDHDTGLYASKAVTFNNEGTAYYHIYLVYGETASPKIAFSKPYSTYGYRCVPIGVVKMYGYNGYYGLGTGHCEVNQYINNYEDEDLTNHYMPNMSTAIHDTFDYVGIDKL